MLSLTLSSNESCGCTVGHAATPASQLTLQLPGQYSRLLKFTWLRNILLSKLFSNIFCKSEQKQLSDNFPLSDIKWCTCWCCTCRTYVTKQDEHDDWWSPLMIDDSLFYLILTAVKLTSVSRSRCPLHWLCKFETFLNPPEWFIARHLIKCSQSGAFNIIYAYCIFISY